MLTAQQSLCECGARCWVRARFGPCHRCHVHFSLIANSLVPPLSALLGLRGYKELQRRKGEQSSDGVPSALWLVGRMRSSWTKMLWALLDNKSLPRPSGSKRARPPLLSQLGPPQRSYSFWILKLHASCITWPLVQPGSDPRSRLAG